MTPEVEAHWRYKLEIMTSYRYHISHGAGLNPDPPEVRWLCEEARYQCHLADAYRRRAVGDGITKTPESCDA